MNARKVALRSSFARARASSFAVSSSSLQRTRHFCAPVTSGATGVYPAAPSPLQEFSVVYTDRALNHMSDPFKKAMNDMGDILKDTYKADRAVIIPGSGTYGMEAVARQFASGK